MLEQLRKANPDFQIHSVLDPEFADYGRVLNVPGTAQLIDELDKREIPAQGNVYVASDAKLEAVPVVQQLQYQVYGGLPVEVGYCNGHSYQLNCLEWHHSPEINVTTQDIVLFLGQESKLHDDHFNTDDIEPFFVPAKTMIMINGSTLHFAPLRTSDAGFKCLVILLQGVNNDLQVPTGVTCKTLFKRSKWLIAHPDNAKFTSQGAFAGIVGPNLELKLK
ncbi:DUF4867 family protein [Lacticaseibacillus sp. GG6-2]